MYDPEFEKKVQQKMEELKFSPSVSVWDRVEKDLVRGRRRRKHIFWILPLLFITAAGGTYFYIHENKPQPSIHENKPQPSAATKSVQLPTVHDNKSVSSGQAQGADGKSSSVQTRKMGGNIDKQREKNNLSSQHAKKHFVALAATRTIKRETTTNYQPSDDRQEVTTEVQASRSTITSKTDNKVTENVTESAAKPLVASPALIQTDQAEKKLDGPNSNTKTEPKGKVSQQASVAKSNAANQKGVRQQKWNFGFSGGIGLSMVYQDLFQSANVSNTTYSNPSGVLYSPSTIRPGVAFNIGFHVQKGIGTRWLFTTGLIYHYYTTKVETGTKVDSTITVMANSTGPFARRSYYARGSNTNYTNHYHFIDLPVTMQYEFARVKKLHLAWEGGFSLSQLIASDELHFDYSTGVYYKGSNQLNKTQFNVNTALLVGLNHNKLSLQMGPQVQYGLTNMLKGDEGGTQHMFFAGLKVVVIPNRR
ncbi:MAG: hypothetical protein C5B59_16395 [Bacteroidetes bacterium]|nr:MAG: hypothetical protein C5B59_16395 [Bacteroidota bacterium]